MYGGTSKFRSKKGLGIAQKSNQFCASVDTLALLAVLQKWQVRQNWFFANGYSFALLAPL